MSFTVIIKEEAHQDTIETYNHYDTRTLLNIRLTLVISMKIR